MADTRSLDIEMLRAFVARLPAPVPDLPGLEEALQRALETGKRANPDLEVDPELFASWLGERIVDGEDPVRAVAMIRADQLYLACACSRGDSAAIAALRDAYFGQVDRALAQLGLAADRRDDLAQQLLVRLTTQADTPSPQIGRYGGRGDLGRWLRAVAVRAGIDRLRSEGREIASSDNDLLDRALPEQDAALACMKERYRATFRAALRQALGTLDARSRMDLRLYYFGELTLDELAALHRVAASTISRRLARTREAVLETTRALLRKEMGVDDSELDSVLRLIESRLELSGSALGEEDR